MNNKVVKGLFVMTFLGLVGLLVVAGAAIAWAAQLADEAPVVGQIQAEAEDKAADAVVEDAPDAPAWVIPGRMMRGLLMGDSMAQRGQCDHAGWMDQELMRETMHTALADALGITVEELEAAMAEGQTPMQLAQELGLDYDALYEVRLAAFDQALEAAVADGRLTQEQADQIRERQQLRQERHDEMQQWREKNGAGMDMGRRGRMHGGMMGNGPGS